MFMTQGRCDSSDARLREIYYLTKLVKSYNDKSYKIGVVQDLSCIKLCCVGMQSSVVFPCLLGISGAKFLRGEECNDPQFGH